MTDRHFPRASSPLPDDPIDGGRVAAEFREMPGLRITVTQAVRLFSLDAGRCRRILDDLVGQGVLSVTEGVFQAVGAGRRHV